MKLVLILGLLLGNTANAAEYAFKYKFDNEKLEIKTQGSSYEEAYVRAAKLCFSHFTKNKRYSESYGLDVIDHCANPNSRLLGQE